MQTLLISVLCFGFCLVSFIPLATYGDSSGTYPAKKAALTCSYALTNDINLESPLVRDFVEEMIEELYAEGALTQRDYDNRSVRVLKGFSTVTGTAVIALLPEHPDTHFKRKSAFFYEVPSLKPLRHIDSFSTFSTRSKRNQAVEVALSWLRRSMLQSGGPLFWWTWRAGDEVGTKRVGAVDSILKAYGEDQIHLFDNLGQYEKSYSSSSWGNSFILLEDHTDLDREAMPSPAHR